MESGKRMLSGNEAIARGAYEVGVKVAAGYPGTPSTEILENIAARYPEIYSEWAPNEKVALEVAIGASFGGARALATMKHVGLNVAADPLFTASYTGVNGGLVIVSADDPGLASSQNEQDNRNYAPFAKIPMLEPADSLEARDFMLLAYWISESYDTPVLLRTTTRVNHGKSVVGFNEPLSVPVKPYETNPEKNVMVPAYARVRHIFVEERTKKLAELAERLSINRIEWGDRRRGVITSGISYQYVKEAAPELSVLKLGMTWPLPEKMIREFAAGVDELLVVEELDPFLETQIRAMGISVRGKELFGMLGELTPNKVRAGLLGEESAKPAEEIPVPGRPPVLCPGCPHRPVFHTLRKQKAIVTGDIGCYTLSALPPLKTHDTCVCMGASIGISIGMARAMDGEEKRPRVAVLGDSTFIHSGITGLIDAVYNQTPITLLILDNRITAMTGGQQNPATGRTLMGKPAPELDLAALCRTVGVKHVAMVDPYDLELMEKTLRDAIAFPGPSVVITQRPCILIDKKNWKSPVEVKADVCSSCGACFRIGCPGIEWTTVEGKDKRVAIINTNLCTGCDVCTQICRFGAIGRKA